MITDETYLEAVEIVANYKVQSKEMKKQQPSIDTERMRIDAILVCLTVLNNEFDLLNRTRKLDIRVKRQAVLWWLAKHTPFTLTKIGQLYGKDHATVIHSIGKIDTYLFTKDATMLYLCKEVWQVLDEHRK